MRELRKLKHITCQGYSLASVVTPSFLLATVLAWPHLQLVSSGAVVVVVVVVGAGGGGKHPWLTEPKTTYIV